MIRKTIITLFMAVAVLSTIKATALGRHGRPYTESDPLVIMCDWDFRPYEFNDKGKPSGYCVEVMDLILTRLEIPHRFEMREWSKAIELFENGEADLLHALGKNYEQEPYFQTKNFVNYYNVRVVYREDTKPLKDLSQLTISDTIVIKPSDYTSFYINQLEFRPYHIRYESPSDALTALTRGEIRYFIWGEMPLKQDIKEMAIEISLLAMLVFLQENSIL